MQDLGLHDHLDDEFLLVGKSEEYVCGFNDPTLSRIPRGPRYRITTEHYGIRSKRPYKTWSSSLNSSKLTAATNADHHDHGTNFNLSNSSNNNNFNLTTTTRKKQPPQPQPQPQKQPLHSHNHSHSHHYHNQNHNINCNHIGVNNDNDNDNNSQQ